MLASLRPSTGNVPVPVLLVLAAMATQQSVVHAQSLDNTNAPYYYWLSPGRIAGIAVGAIALIFLVLSMLIFACRRRRHAKSSSKVVVSNFSGAGGYPQSYPSWQEGQQTSYGPGAPNMGWHYPAQSTPLSEQAKGTASKDQVQRATPSEQMTNTGPFGDVRRTPTSEHVQRPVPTSQVQSTATPGQVQRPGPAPTSPVQRPATTSPVLSTAAPGQVHRVALPSRAQSTAVSGQVLTTVPSTQAQRIAPPGQAQSIAPSGRTQTTAPFVRTQELGILPPPRHALTKGTQNAGATNGMDQSPPPYSPPAGTLTPPAAHPAQ